MDFDCVTCFWNPQAVFLRRTWIKDAPLGLYYYTCTLLSSLLPTWFSNWNLVWIPVCSVWRMNHILPLDKVWCCYHADNLDCCAFVDRFQDISITHVSILMDAVHCFTDCPLRLLLNLMWQHSLPFWLLWDVVVLQPEKYHENCVPDV